MLAVNRETDYAARVILHLALQPPGSRTTARQIAKLRLIPGALVRRVVTRLGAAGLITTTRGNNGGISLARPAAEISLLEVVEAMEGPLALNSCTVEPDLCPLMPVCTVHLAWVEARDVLRKTLSSVSFAALAQKGGVSASDPPSA